MGWAPGRCAGRGRPRYACRFPSDRGNDDEEQTTATGVVKRVFTGDYSDDRSDGPGGRARSPVATTGSDRSGDAVSLRRPVEQLRWHMAATLAGCRRLCERLSTARWARWRRKPRIDAVWRDTRGQHAGVLARRLGDLDLAEEALPGRPVRGRSTPPLAHATAVARAAGRLVASRTAVGARPYDRLRRRRQPVRTEHWRRLGRASERPKPTRWMSLVPPLILSRAVHRRRSRSPPMVAFDIARGKCGLATEEIRGGVS
jgi:hypothetical protein